MLELKVRAADLVKGDFLDRTERTLMRGPRGGRYEVQAWRVQSAVVDVVRGLSQRRHFGIVVTMADGGKVWLAHSTVCHVRRQTPVAVDRAEADPCQRNTPGCSVDHDAAEAGCETW